jgi:hypothetical protein
VTTNGQTTYLGLQFAGVSSGISGYVALISRAGGTGVTTLSIVKTSGACTAPTMTSIGGAAVTLPTAVEGDRWQVKVRGTWLAPSFTLASFLVTVTTATGAAYTVGMPSALPISQYATDTGQSGTTWATVDAYVGFLNRPSVPLFAPFTSQGDAVPNQWETLRLKDVGALSTPETATVAPSLVGQPTLTVVPVDAEDDPSGLELSINPSFTVALSDQWIVNELVADSGDHTQFPRQTKRRRRWQFHWSALDSTEFDTLSTLNDDIGGRYQSVTWEDPTTGLSETIRFITPISFSQVGPDTWKASATVEEVFT